MWKKKEVMSLKSGNTCGAELWSDTKEIYPMLPQISPVQKCLSCGYFYFVSEVDYKFSNDNYSNNLGTLSIEECKNAIQQMMNEGINKDKEFIIRLEAFYRFNDIYYRHKETARQEPKQDEWFFFYDNANHLLRLLKNDNKRILLRSEILRETGQFEKCINLLSKPKTFLQSMIHKENKIEDFVKNQILMHAREKDGIVFKLALPST